MPQSSIYLLRRLGLGLAMLGVATGAHAELGNASDNSAACCQLTTSLVNDVLRGSDVSGDERFFSAEGAPPNIHFILDTSGSMQELPQVINSRNSEFFGITVNGCENPRLDADATARGWDPSFQYPVPDQGTNLGADTGFPNLFQDDKFYGWLQWGSSSNPTPTWNTKEAACELQVGSAANPVEYARCITCLNTKGYYLVPGTTGRDFPPLQNNGFIFWGRYLNFNPPKYVTARKVLKQVIKELRRVRAGLSHFSNSAPSTVMDRGQAPSCSQIINDASSFDSSRASYINDINGWTFNTSTPLARSLLNIGYYFTSDDGVYRDVFGFGPSPNYSYPPGFRNGALSSQTRSVCWGCQVSSAIIITDGEPRDDSLSPTVRARLRALNGGPVYCPDNAPCGVGSLNGRDKGANDDPTEPNRFNDDNPDYYLDDVARLLYEQDLQRHTPPIVGDFNTAGKQSLITYTVGFGINSPFLKHTAEVGGGLYYTAQDEESLERALLEIIANVQTRATSFSSPASSTLQVRSASATLIPRFKPARNAAAPWQGLMYRFDMGPELLLGCDPTNPGVGDLNQDDDCEDTFLLDAQGDAIIENDEGNFVKLLSPLTPAVPFWEAGSLMRPPGNNTTNWQRRKIYTIVDNAAPFGTLDYRDTPVEFTEANSAILREYLGISLNPDTCDDIALQLGLAALPPDDCAKLVIRWYRGADALNPDPALRGFDRPFLLHDIFHSSPANVDPPIPQDFCDFSNQCVQALFAGSTVQDDSYTLPGRSGVMAYEKYEYEAGNRDKIVLVGSNGGMLHAFHNGRSNNDVDTFTGQRKYNNGTGQELWAFIPPDLLPKLRPNLNKHAYFVDAAPMVRDVWIDGAGNQPGDGKKQWQEYRTVAVIGTGRGGVHRFALDLTRLLGVEPGDTSNLVPDRPGDFLWMWPQPCDPLSLQVGESFSNFAPRPPPILPVALSPQADDALRTLYGPTSGTPETPHSIEGDPARERYVVLFNGGFDPSMTRGRGMAIVDIKSGHTLWSFFYGDGSTLRAQNLRYPIGAGIGGMDYGRATDINGSDYLFDTGTVGDYGGQLWTLRFWKPGNWDSARQRVTNWFAARAFRTANLAGQTSDAEAIRAPFSYMTLNSQQQDNGFVRSFIGTGDRENLMDKGLACRLSNPRACAAQGRTVNNTLTVSRGGSTTFTARANYDNYRYASGAALTGNAGPSCAGAQVSLSWVHSAATGCTNPGDCKIEYTCDGDTSTWSCRETDNDWVALNYTSATAPYPQRYYGVWVYGGSDPRRHFNNDTEANIYESNMFTDADLTNVSQFDAQGNVIATTQVSASPAGKGWYVQYGAANERTGTTGTIVNGCVLWSSFEPSGVAGAVCSTTGTNIGRLYQSNFATGVANCAISFYDPQGSRWARFRQETLVATPPEPMMQVSIGAGVIQKSVARQGAGINDGTAIDIDFDGMKSLFQIELDRRGHNCRHVPGGQAECD